MRKKIIIYCMTALLLMVAASTELILMQREDFPFSVVISSEGGSEKIGCWRRNDVFYVFLPAYTDKERTELKTNWLFPVSIEGRRIEKGVTCGAFPLEEPLGLSYRKWGRTYEETVVFLQSGKTPALYIDTASGSMDFIHEAKGNAEGGKLRLYTPEGKLDCDGQLKAINGRGNSTWEDSEKKSYSLELSGKADLLGMGAAKKWILLSNTFDASHINNKMAYDFAAKAGCAYTPECRWVELYLNGNYAGLYLLSERNEIDPQRVAIPENGSFLISMELVSRQEGRNYDGFFSTHGSFFRIHSTGAPTEQVSRLWQSAENAIFAEDGIDPVTGKPWDALIDVESWAQQFLLWDVFMEYDAAAISKYFYYDSREDRIFAGPVWDMDLILGNIGAFPPSILASERRHIWGAEEEALFYRLYQKDSFRETVKRLYREEYRPLLLELADTGMTRYLEQIHQSAALNRIRWEHPTDSETEVHARRDFLRARIAFLDDFRESEADYCILEIASGEQWRSYAVRRGEPAEFLKSLCPRWIDFETGEPFDPDVPVTENRVIASVEEEE